MDLFRFYPEMQHMTCESWFLKVHSLTKADELRSFQNLDINEIH